MRTLLTGATGLIGANLVRTLLRAGERPRVLLTPGSVDDFVKFQRDDMARAQKIVTEGNIRVE